MQLKEYKTKHYRVGNAINFEMYKTTKWYIFKVEFVLENRIL